MQVAGSLQEILDAQCIAAFATMCRDNEEFCEFAVARKDANQAGATKWRCYAYSKLIHSGASVGCVDDCGNMISCPGEPASDSVGSIAREDLSELVEVLKEGTCKLQVCHDATFRTSALKHTPVEGERRGRYVLRCLLDLQA